MSENVVQYTIAQESAEANLLEEKPESTSAEFHGVPNWVVASGQYSARVLYLTRPTATTSNIDEFWWFTGAGTSDRHVIKHEMEVLDAVARTENTDVFVTLLNSLTWSGRSADDFVHAVRLCLALGLHAKARELALEGADQHPGHSDLQRLKHLLGPARVIQSKLSSDSNAAANMKWLREHAQEYRGQYVALKNGELLATGASHKEILETVGNIKNSGILVTMVY